jgi:MFS family permease
MLPLWQAEFALSLTQVGMMRSLYWGAMAAFQVPAGFLAERWGERGLLALGTAVTALGFVTLGLAGGAASLALILLIAGAGSGVQHPLCSSVVSKAYEDGAQRAVLGIYNFSGDVGKMVMPVLAALVAASLGWRWATTGYGVVGVSAALAVFIALGVLGAGVPPHRPPKRARIAYPTGGWGIRNRRGFKLLSAIGIVDQICRSTFMTFLPFLLIAKGAGVETVGLALALIFGGGAAGKFLCGILAERIGIVRTVVLSELITGGGSLLLLPLPLELSLVLLPVIGVGLNGTSSVLYGTVAEFVTPERRSRGFALFYTLSIGAGAVAPSIFGVVSDLAGVPVTLTIIGLLVFTTIPLARFLRTSLAAGSGPEPNLG